MHPLQMFLVMDEGSVSKHLRNYSLLRDAKRIVSRTCHGSNFSGFPDEIAVKGMLWGNLLKLQLFT